MRKPRMYSLFCKEGKNWTRLTPVATNLKAARRLFQDLLLAGTTRGYNMRLRPAEDDFANAAAYKANLYRIFTPKTTVAVMDHTTNAEGELVEAGPIVIELDD